MKITDIQSIGWAVWSSRIIKLETALMPYVKGIVVSHNRSNGEIAVAIDLDSGCVQIATIAPYQFLELHLFDHSARAMAIHVANLVSEELGEMCRWN